MLYNPAQRQVFRQRIQAKCCHSVVFLSVATRLAPSHMLSLARQHPKTRHTDTHWQCHLLVPSDPSPTRNQSNSVDAGCCLGLTKSDPVRRNISKHPFSGPPKGPMFCSILCTVDRPGWTGLQRFVSNLPEPFCVSSHLGCCPWSTAASKKSCNTVPLLPSDKCHAQQPTGPSSIQDEQDCRDITFPGREERGESA